ncbi:LysR family transcriptional regulator [Roseateles sp.]|uniref:LysR family transcriptional regulator n=1 Tax=Roseateles sp. TaxID=1971397 RepID=UPI003D1358D2
MDSKNKDPESSASSNKLGKDIGWELYRTFLGVLQEGSQSGAARALGLAQPTVGRHIEALEQALGLPLFTRSQQGLLPTEAALTLREGAEAMARQAAALQRLAQERQLGAQGQLRGVVRVTASEVMGVEVLPPILARLAQEEPGLVIELVLSSRMQDLLQREADIAVRMTAPTQEQLIARRLGTLELGLFARSDYLDRAGRPAMLEDLAAHRLVGYDQETPFIRAARQGFPSWRREAFALRSDSDLAQLALLRAGAGIGVCQVALARRSPGLERVLPEQLSLPLETWLAMHEDLRQSLACKRVFEALAEGLSEMMAAPA